MISTGRLYAYAIEPKETPAIWGGDALVKRYAKYADPAAAIGESWECWDENRIANGALAGETLGDLRRTLAHELTGPIDPSCLFPILTKIIDARQPLSVQVHPDDAYAQRVENQPFGKTECWYILAAEPGAELVLGWNRDTDRDEYARCSKLSRVRRMTDFGVGESRMSTRPFVCVSVLAFAFAACRGSSETPLFGPGSPGFSPDAGDAGIVDGAVPVLRDGYETSIPGLFLVGDLTAGKTGGSIISAFNSASDAMRALCEGHLDCPIPPRARS